MGISQQAPRRCRGRAPVIPVGAHPIHASCTMARPVKFPTSRSRGVDLEQ